jgi:DNA/RNA-binding domain of Phe-tRNA-synthetase-like protein
MQFWHSPAIWSDYPSLVPGLMLVEGIVSGTQLGEQLEPLYARARARLANASEGELPEVQAWRRAFSQMGFKPTQYRSAGEALLRRFRKEGALPTLHPLVDVCNAVSLAFALPVAVLDLDQVDGFLEVRYADGDETYLSFGDETEHPEPREVIFADAARHVHARRWTFRQSKRSTVSETTTRALVVSEALHTGAANDIPHLLETLERELRAAGYTTSQRAILRAEEPLWQM